MSLQLIAKQMEAKGRKGDSMLVHMTPGEVEGLQKLAESIGETLTVNPETGLVEANILKSLLAVGAGALGTAYFGPIGGQIAGTLAGSLLGGKDGQQGSERQGGAGRVRAGEDVQLRSPYEMPRSEKDYPYAYGESRPIVAAQGGLMHLAEGGMTGASGDAFEYLMGNRPTAVQPAQAPVVAAPATPSNKMFLFDPATGTFTRNPNYADPMAKAPIDAVLPGFSGDGGGRGDSGGGGDGHGGSLGSTTDAQMADYYRDNPAMGKFTRTLQEYNPFARMQEYFDPGFTVRQADIALSGVPNAGIVSGGLRDPQQRAEMARQAAESVSETGGGGNDGNVGDGGSTEGGRGVDGTATGGMGESTARAQGGSLYLASGGLAALARGGMASGGFVVPADVVSALGNGSTDAGLRALKALLGKIKPIKGKGDGLSDSIKTNIDGKQPARVADGEAYIDPQTVKRIGGAQKLYAMMDKIRAQAHGKTTQQRKVNPAKV